MNLREDIKKQLDETIELGIFPGAAVGLILPTGEREVITAGHYTTDDKSPVVTADSLYDIASVTKSIPTAALALYYIDQGKLNLDDRAIDYLPELTGRFMDEITIRHLLNFTIRYGFGLGAVMKQQDLSAEDLLEIIFTTDLPVPPGNEYVYTNSSAILLGLIVEKAGGKSLDKLAEEIFWQPLGMERTLYRPLDKFPKEEIVPTEIDERRGGAIRGEIHDESAHLLSRIITPGSAGLFSSVSDLLNFMEMLLAGGEKNGRKYFSPEIINKWRTPADVTGFTHAGLGWDVAMDYMGDKCGRGVFGKTGFTGTSFVCDPDRDAGIVILSNHTYPKRPDNRDIIAGFRAQIADTVWENM